MKKKRVIKKVKWKTLGKMACFAIVLCTLFFYLWNLKTKNIIIKGNNLITDHEIITSSGFQDYPYLFRTSTKKMKENLQQISLLDEIKIHKSLLGTLTIEVKEASPLFYNRTSEKLVLSNHQNITSQKFYGVPVLINYVPETYYNKLIDELKEIHPDVLRLISEIEYQPWQSNNVMIDETRFFLRMNDSNSVYVNLIHMEKLNTYIEIYASLEGKHGILYLDSSSDKISFSEYK